MISRRNPGSGFDAFLFYSDDNVRMAEILGLRDDEDQEDRRGDTHIDMNADEASGENIDMATVEAGSGEDHHANDNPRDQNAINRKTRVSFEVHDIVYRQRYL